jgi:phage protein U
MLLDTTGIIKDEVFAKLGDFTFKLKTLVPDKIDRETSYRWVKQEPVGAAAIFQYLGAKDPKNLVPHEEKMTLTGVLYPEYSGQIDHLKRLREMAATGKAHRLVYADTQIGQNMGLWAIKSIKESRSFFWGDGVPRRIEFTLELEFHALS